MSVAGLPCAPNRSRRADRLILRPSMAFRTVMHFSGNICEASVGNPDSPVFPVRERQFAHIP